MSLARSQRQYMGVRAILPPDLQTAKRDPTGTDTAYVIGTLWLNTVGLTTWQWSGTTWIAMGSGATGGVVTINSLAPVAGNIIIAGTTNQVAVANAGHTVTLSIPSTFIAPGTIASTTTIHAGTSLSAATTITATLGAITATNGNFVLGTAGNKIISTSVASTTTAGANSFGIVTLSSGAAVVATTAALTGSIIFLTVQSLGTVTAPTPVAVTARTNGVSFTITSSDNTDTSSIGWMIVN